MLLLQFVGEVQGVMHLVGHILRQILIISIALAHRLRVLLAIELQLVLQVMEHIRLALALTSLQLAL